MGQIKKLFEEMEMNLYLTDLIGDEDYQFELYRQQQLEDERAAYEEHLADKYQND